MEYTPKQEEKFKAVGALRDIARNIIMSEIPNFLIQRSIFRYVCVGLGRTPIEMLKSMGEKEIRQMIQNGLNGYKPPPDKKGKDKDNAKNNRR